MCGNHWILLAKQLNIEYWSWCCTFQIVATPIGGLHIHENTERVDAESIALYSLAVHLLNNDAFLMLLPHQFSSYKINWSIVYDFLISSSCVSSRSVCNLSIGRFDVAAQSYIVCLLRIGSGKLRPKTGLSVDSMFHQWLSAGSRWSATLSAVVPLTRHGSRRIGRKGNEETNFDAGTYFTVWCSVCFIAVFVAWSPIFS